MNCICGNELVGKQRFCSDKCRMAYNRDKANKPEQKNAPESIVRHEPERTRTTVPLESEQSEQIFPEQSNPNNPFIVHFGGLADCECMMCKTARTNGHKANINHGDYAPASALTASGFTVNRVALPGDTDYVGICSESQAIGRRPA